MKRLSGKRLFIYCAGGQGRETLQTVQASGVAADDWTAITFVDDACPQEYVNGISVVTYEQYLAMRRDTEDWFIVANGEPIIRRRLTEKLKQQRVEMATIFYPRTFLPKHTEVCMGVFVGERVCLSDNVMIGEGVQINAGAIIGHNAQLGDFSTLSPGCIVSGDVTIGAGTYIGTGAVIRDEVKIGKNCIIGMGSLVTGDIPDNVVAYGSPCRVVRENTDGIVFR